MIKFNFKYIKDKSAPGSWRRGYNYFKKKQILSSELKDNAIIASVKGSFQDSYDIKLNLSEEEITAECSCPLEEEWCKHTISVALDAVENHFYEKYITSLNGQEFEFEEENPPEITTVEGSYKFVLNTKPNMKFLGIQILDRHNENKVVSNIEGVLRAVIELQKQSNNNFEFNVAQKREFALLQHIYKYANVKNNVQWFNIHNNKIGHLIPYLSQVEEVIDSETKKRLLFKKSPWQLILKVNVSIVGNVLLSLHWERPDIADTLPLEEVMYFHKQVKWGKYKNTIVPLDTNLSKLPGYLTKSTFTDIRDADGGKFVYEELPRLKKLMTVDVFETLEKLTLEQKPPINVLTLETEDSKIKACLEFEYDGEIVPYGKLAEKTPYVTIKKPKKDIIYWIKRNLELEELAYKQLLQSRFSPSQTNNLFIESDDAIDFYNYLLPNAGDNWKIKSDKDLSNFKMSKTPLKIAAEIDFSEEADSFEMELFFTVGRTRIEFETIHKHYQLGEKYLYLEKRGNVEIPFNKVILLTKSLTNVDAIKNDEEKFVIKTFRAGIIAEFIDLDANLKMSKKFKAFWQKISSFNSIDDIALPRGINAELRDYQKKGFNWLWFLYTYGLNGILADDMGLGKTLQTLTLIQKAKEKDGSFPNLVVCPTSVVFNWEAEIEKFAPTLKCLNLTGSARKDFFKKINDYDVVITSYALLRRDIAQLKKHQFRSLILDETQNIKNYESLTALSAKEINAHHKLAVSGTPIENRLSELWSIFDFLMPGFLYDINEFNYRYAVPIQEKGDKTVGDRLKKQVSPYILRRLKRDMAKDLPAKIENIAYCQMTTNQRDFYLDVLDSTRQEIFGDLSKNDFNKKKMSVFAALLRLRQICCHPKLFDKEGKMGALESGKFEHLKEMIQEITSEGHKILLFSQFVEMLDIIKAWLVESNIKHEYLTGQTKDRQQAVENFNNNPDIPIFLISLKAGGTGLNLTGADYVIHYDPWWNPAVEDQATDRAHRIGQTKNVFVYRLITKGSVEEKIMKLKERKRNLVDSVISTERELSKTFTFDDMKEIFSTD